MEKKLDEIWKKNVLKTLIIIVKHSYYCFKNIN